MLTLNLADAFWRFWILTHALSMSQKKVSCFSTDVRIPPAVFESRKPDNWTGVSSPGLEFAPILQAYRGLKILKLWFNNYNQGHPRQNVDRNLIGLQVVLKSMTNLEYFDLRLPGDGWLAPSRHCPYEFVFPRNGLWANLKGVSLHHLAACTQELVHLLLIQMPDLKHLHIGTIDLLNGNWPAMIELLKCSARLDTFNIFQVSWLYQRDLDGGRINFVDVHENLWGW